MDLEHPGDSFGRRFRPRTSFSDQFGSISLISDVSERISESVGVPSRPLILSRSSLGLRRKPWMLEGTGRDLSGLVATLVALRAEL